MRVTINPDVLGVATAFVKQFVPSRGTLPILMGVLVEASGGKVTFTVFDYETSAQQTVTADVEEEGTVLVSAFDLAAFAAKAKQPVDLVSEERSLVAKSGRWTVELPLMPTEEYPDVPQITEWVGEVDADEFSTAVQQVAVAASTDSVTPHLMGVHMLFDDDLTLEATDRYRVAAQKVPASSKAGGWTGGVLVPARTLASAVKTAHGKVGLGVTRGERALVGFRVDDAVVTSVQMSGNYPPVQRLFPADTSHHVTVDVSALRDSVQRVSAFVEKESAIRCVFDEGRVTLESSGSDGRATSDTAPAEDLVGDRVLVGLKPLYLLDALKHCLSESATVTFTPGGTPSVPKPVLFEDGHGYRHLVMPTRL